MTPREYQALFKVWRDGQLTLRVAYSLCGMTDGSEFDEYQNYLAMMPQGFGDDMLHFNGIGERITWAMNGVNGMPPEDDKEKYYEIVRWAAAARPDGDDALEQRRERRRAAGHLGAREPGVPDRATCDGRSPTSTTRRRRRFSA